MSSENPTTGTPVEPLVRTRDWLIALGAKRPMAVASDDVLVLGKWQYGHYPIEWRRDVLGRVVAIRDDHHPTGYRREHAEDWFLFGHRLLGNLTEDDCRTILMSIG